MSFLDNPLVVSTVMLLFGIVVKYWPAMKEFPNRLIVVCNLVIGLAMKLLTPEQAHAGFFQDLGHSLGTVVIPLEAILARQMYETFLRPILEHFGITGYPSAPVKLDKQHKPS